MTVINGVPSCLNRSIRTVTATVVVLERTISDDQIPPDANCGKITAAGPPTPVAICGTDAGGERLVIGMVLKFVSRNRKATIATGMSDVIVRLPSVPAWSSGTSENSSLMNL